jgi:putative ABC transport system substrate-binding protein
MVQPLKVVEAADFESAFKRARSEGAGAIHVLPSPFFYLQRRRLIELAAKYRLPAVYELREFVEEGGLMSYGPSINEMFRASAGHVDRILKGAKPGDLPIERPATFELVFNLKTAKALGLTIPPSVLARADQVIE